jgi:hypothetical protein
MAKDSRPLLTQTQLKKNTSHKIDPLDDKKNSPGKKKGHPDEPKKKNKEVRAKIRDI